MRLAPWLALAACGRLPPSTEPPTADPSVVTDRPEVTDASDVPATDATDTAAAAPIQPATVIGFNVESGGADPAVVAAVVTSLGGAEIWGFAEVESAEVAADLVAAAAGAGQTLRHVVGSTGWSDRLVLAWDDARYEAEATEELHDINVGGTARAPLVVTLRERSTDASFRVMVNHLWRTEADARHEQAALLNDWGRDQALPFVAIGDYNFDWKVTGGDTDHDAGYDQLTRDGVFTWVKPDPLVRTQCSAWYDSVLDFAFVGGGAQAWPAASEVLRTDAAYCEEAANGSDHRPVRLVIGMAE